MRPSRLRSYGYVWVTLALFAVSLAGHWMLGWYAFVNEQAAHGQAPLLSDFLITIGRDTLENWQSEFLQLIWQVAGLAFLLFVGSPQSREGDERREEKLDLLLLKLGGEDMRTRLEQLDRKYPRR